MNLLVIGNSEKLVRFTELIYPTSKRIVIPWRSLPIDSKMANDIASTKWDICLIAGYDYSAARSSYNSYICTNVTNVMHILQQCASKDSLVIYANTMKAKKGYTFSRYLYAKMMLGEALLHSFPNAKVLEFSTIIESGKIATTGGFISRFVFKALLFFGALSTTVINEGPESNIKLLSKLANKPTLPKPMLLYIPRPLIIDRALRFILG